MNQIGKASNLIKINDDDIWDQNLALSLESNPFLSSKFLRSIGQEDSRFALYDSKQFVAGACIFDYKGQNFDLTHSFCVYQGMFFPNSNKERYSDENLRLNRMEDIIKSIDFLNRPMRMSMHFNINDLRAIDWYYYENSKSNLSPRTRIKYTGLIRTDEFSNFDEYLLTIRKERLREVRRSLEAKSRIEYESRNVEEFMELYSKTFRRQGLENSDHNLKRAYTIIQDAISQNYGKLSMLYSPQGEPISSVFILSDKRTDTYLFGANDMKYKHFHGSTRLLINAISMAFSHKKQIFDFCGMNSPHRGKFKSSFNARLTPYFEVDLVTRKVS